MVAMCRLVGCQDLLSDTPSQVNNRRDSSTLSPMDSKTLDRRMKVSRSISRPDHKYDIVGGIATDSLQSSFYSLLLVECENFWWL